MRTYRFTTCLFLTFCAHEASAQGRLSKPVIDTLRGGIVRVMSAGPTAWSDTSGWKLVLERVVQPKDGAPGEFGNPYLIQLLNDGRLLVADRQPTAVKLFDAKGNFTRAIGRDGEGPGEYRNPEFAVFHDSLFIHDNRLIRGTVMTLDGKVARTFPTVCCYAGNQVAASDRGVFRMLGAIGNGKGQWISFDASGTRVDSVPRMELAPSKLWEAPVSGGLARYGIPLSPQNPNLLLRDGRLLYGSTSQYQFIVTRTGRDTAWIFGRSGVVPLPVPDGVRDSLFHRAVDRNDALKAVAQKGDIPSSFPLWESIVEDGAGNFWVSAGGQPQGPVRFDVFARDGRFLGSVAAPFRDAFRTSFTADHVAVIAVDENDLPLVRIYRIVKVPH